MNSRYRPFHSRRLLSAALSAAFAAACGDVAPDDTFTNSGDPNNPNGMNGGVAGAGAGAGSNGGGVVGAAGAPGGIGGPVTGLEGGFTTPDMRPMESCITLDVKVERLTPSVLLLLDRSGSMDAEFGLSNRWDTLRDILVNPQTGVITTLADEIQFGIATYTSLNGFAGPDEEAPVTDFQCPTIESIPIGTTTLAAAEAFLPFADTLIGDSDTPTAESITAAAQMLTAQATVVGPKALILATDGEPDTCALPDSQGEEPPRAASVAAVTSAYEAGIETYVISVGSEVSGPHLQDLATAGLGGKAGAVYYQALDAQALADAFNEIIYGVTPCEFELNGTVQPGGAAQGTVLIGGAPAALEDPNGWSLPTPSTIVLNGSACDAAKRGELIDIDFPCNVFVVK